MTQRFHRPNRAADNPTKQPEFDAQSVLRYHMSDRELVMQISLDEAIDIHAKVQRARYGSGAAASSKRRAARCKCVGDLDGERVWLRVADALERCIETVESQRRH
jgi:hypothetical protein